MFAFYFHFVLHFYFLIRYSLFIIHYVLTILHFCLLMKKSFIEELTWRGMIQDMTPGLEERLNSGMVIGYIGFDPTASSMTIGNYVQLMLLTHFNDAGTSQSY